MPAVGLSGRGQPTGCPVIRELGGGARAAGRPTVAVVQQYLDLTDEQAAAVITETGTHPNVAALVYIAAFAPDKGESVNSLLAGFRPVRRSRRSCLPRTATLRVTDGGPGTAEPRLR